MICKTCNKDNVIKAGISHGKQRYKCKDCAVHFIAHHKHLSESDRLRVVRFCSYGLPMNTVAKMFLITVTSVARWVKLYKAYPNQELLPDDVLDRLTAKGWTCTSKYSKRQYVLIFRLRRLKNIIQNYQSVKPQKIILSS